MTDEKLATLLKEYAKDTKSLVKVAHVPEQPRKFISPHEKGATRLIAKDVRPIADVAYVPEESSVSEGVDEAIATGQMEAELEIIHAKLRSLVDEGAPVELVQPLLNAKPKNAAEMAALRTKLSEIERAAQNLADAEEEHGLLDKVRNCMRACKRFFQGRRPESMVASKCHEKAPTMGMMNSQMPESAMMHGMGGMGVHGAVDTAELASDYFVQPLHDGSRPQSALGGSKIKSSI